MKPCPYCAEQIQDNAIRCRFCFKDLPGGNTDPRAVRELKNAGAWIGIWAVGLFFAWNIGGGIADGMDWPVSIGHWGGVGIWTWILEQLDNLTQKK